MRDATPAPRAPPPNERNAKGVPGEWAEAQGRGIWRSPPLLGPVRTMRLCSPAVTGRVALLSPLPCTQGLSTQHFLAPEGRQSLAHGASRGFMGGAIESPGGAKEVAGRPCDRLHNDVGHF